MVIRPFKSRTPNALNMVSGCYKNEQGYQLSLMTHTLSLDKDSSILTAIVSLSRYTHTTSLGSIYTYTIIISITFLIFINDEEKTMIMKDRRHQQKIAVNNILKAGFRMLVDVK